ncbi:RlpA-like double-psi beta-barrel domain-containing protein [Oceanobacillus bengalensis]|uniref:DUF3889 domain-containing protein n=1 Tax=Oceanobacillus bengalensis TaxID=1435466 RepID=A0A494Z7X7_9BACI|nr:RlpA-like double-psi beta-barrel domain-containing protein [Oceanobacillus bengalensis]RKQ18695.1 DUF3889 domain-containing protein [Oceanobacillus bengalensis]
MYPYNPYMNNYRNNDPYFNSFEHRQTITGQATWTEGGQVTKCNIPWSDYNQMTAAVGEDSPFRCGQIIKVRNLSAPVGREVFVKIVDEVQGYPINRINLHRAAFAALGINPSVGVINVEMTPLSNEQEKNWADYFISVVETAFPAYTVSNYEHVGKSGGSSSQTKDSYEFMLESPQGSKHIAGDLVYDANTNDVISLLIRQV